MIRRLLDAYADRYSRRTLTTRFLPRLVWPPARIRVSHLISLSILLTSCELASAEPVTDVSDFDPQPLAHVLDQASYVVRGRPVSSRVETASSGERYLYVAFNVTEVLKGTVSATDIRIRRSASPESRDGDGIIENDANDVIVALGARNPADGSYDPAPGFSTGEYRVEPATDGSAVVLVNAFGVNADSVTPKDVHRKVANARVPLETFRRIAKDGEWPAEPSPAAEAPKTSPGPASTPLPLPEAKAAVAAQLPASEPERRGWAWMAIAAALAAIAIGTWVILKRTNTSRRK